MNRKNILFMGILFIPIFFSTCDLNDNKLLLINNSNATIYYLAYPDTIVNIKSVENFAIIPYRKISIGDSTHPIFARLNEGGFKNKINDVSIEKRLHMFYFFVDSVNKYGWEKVLKLNLFKREDYSENELDSLKWIIKFKR
jgi:hypothetical protein